VKQCLASGTYIERTGEHYTSKCCLKCRKIHKHLGGAEIFQCPRKKCRWRESRDAGACRKIGIKVSRLYINSDIIIYNNIIIVGNV